MEARKGPLHYYLNNFLRPLMFYGLANYPLLLEIYYWDILFKDSQLNITCSQQILQL